MGRNARRRTQQRNAATATLATRVLALAFAHLTLRGFKPERRGDRFYYGDPGGGTGESEWFPRNLIQLCAQQPQPSWSTIVRDFFDSTHSGFEEARKLVSNFASAKAALRPQLYPRPWGEPHQSAILARPLTDELQVVLTLELATSVFCVPHEIASSWGMTDDELFSIAVSNLHTLPFPKPEPSRLGGLQVYVWKGDLLTAAHFLRAAELVDVPETGALVTLPTRRELRVVPLLTPPALEEVVALSLETVIAFACGPSALSYHVYWLGGGTLTAIPVQRTRGGFDVVWPEGLAPRR